MGTTTTEMPVRRPNKRGIAAREKLLATALQVLATGRPESASVNLIAKQAGLSWGSVQNLFGDADGFWANVVDSVVDAGSVLWVEPTTSSAAERLAEVAELYASVLVSPYGIAVETVRGALPRQVDDLVDTHPKTAQALHALDERSAAALVTYFDGLGLDDDRVRDVCAVLASGLRGLRTDALVGAPTDVDRARRTLVAALSAHLTA